MSFKGSRLGTYGRYSSSKALNVPFKGSRLGTYRRYSPSKAFSQRLYVGFIKPEASLDF